MREKAYTVIYTVLIAAVFTAAVSGARLATQHRVDLNRELSRKRVIMKVLGVEAPAGATLDEIDALYGQSIADTGLSYDGTDGPAPILARKDAGGKVLSYAFPVAGNGLWGVIRGYVAVSADLKTIQGVAFHQHNETPGLGAEITEPWFESQFQGKSIDADRVGRLIRFLPAGSELGPGDVDAVTGATLTSRGVEALLDDGLRAFLSVMRESGAGVAPAEES